ncbi:LysR family transcriptional regulator [Caballeronia sp. LZ029]|uniref:LysR family transcriptional regulator n=1 Tax=Caballeronia sp. LZ029 TaxID=3038564 RepID=UPI0028617BCB|nr:LysR family transcriptional regulator [Caballeronia sp. LZ029]MDR5744753.1 LysR family transcriptional regulator [Caballeronia sp. LZ029]
MTELSRLEIRALQVFEAVAAEGSVSAAASRLGVTQSAVSQTIAQIEEVLGTKVLDRSRRPIRLTSAGIALRRDAHSVVEEMNRLLANAREADAANRPEIRIGMIDSYAATVGPAVVKEAIHQGHQVVLWAGLAYRHSQALLQRQLDLIVTSDALEDMDRLVRRPLFSEPFMIVLPAGRKEKIREGVIADIARQLPLVRFSTTSHYGALTERYLRRCGISAKRHLEIDASDVVLSMVAADLGWAITTPLVLLQSRGYLKDVCVLPISGPPLTRTIYQVSRAGEYEETAEYFYQTSRRVLETAVFPEIKSLLPDAGLKLHLS